jgi:glycosyltransferase involved in cell wall biosynthesis
MTEFTDQGNLPRLPSVAVSMPAHNAAPFIGAAIDSVLAQRGVEVQLVVVDDASTDGTGDVAARFADRGVRLHRNMAQRGIGFCHNLVIRETTAPLIAHVDADDTLAPDALAKLARAVQRDERAGQAYCDFYDIDRDGVVSASTRERWRDYFVRHRTSPIDHARELVVHGMVVNCLRTYRRRVFDTVGGFDEGLPWAVDYEMALRIAEHFAFAHVPEMLYARRVHAAGVTQRLRARPWRFWWMRWKLVRRQLRAQGGVLLGRGAVVTHARLLLGLAYALRAAITPVSTDS